MAFQLKINKKLHFIINTILTSLKKNCISHQIPIHSRTLITLNIEASRRQKNDKWVKI